jgi:hypothetical protein
VRRSPVAVAPQSKDRARLFRLVDDARTWPFFSAYRLQLSGDERAPAAWKTDSAAGIFQQVVVVEGEVELSDNVGLIATLTKDVPAFIPATATGGYTLRASNEAAVLIFSPPSPRGVLFKEET